MDTEAVTESTPPGSILRNRNFSLLLTGASAARALISLLALCVRDMGRVEAFTPVPAKDAVEAS